jgi:hypothetical protein
MNRIFTIPGRICRYWQFKFSFITAGREPAGIPYDAGAIELRVREKIRLPVKSWRKDHSIPGACPLKGLHFRNYREHVCSRNNHAELIGFSMQ